MYFHGSRKSFHVGFMLLAQPDGYVHCEDAIEFERVMDARRPQGLLSRFESVFLTKDPDLIDGAGGYIDVIYRVDPIGKAEASDLYWYSEAYCEWVSEPKTLSRLHDLIDAYWSGKPAPFEENSNIEYRVTQARVIAVHELNVEAGELEEVYASAGIAI
ncbi:hypothetical protein ACI2KR_31030 [Pseudomonas luteola]